jgi:HTH-type transcriptional regulator / antitoxin HipB
VLSQRRLTVKNTETISSKTVGALVRQRRLANHLTQRQLGELAGVGLRLVSELERGKSTLRMDAANRVLAVFGLMLGPIEAPRSADGEL